MDDARDKAVKIYTGLSDFWRIAAELRRFWAWIVASASLPFLASLIDISPPWPKAIPVLTSIITILALIVAYQFFKSAGKRAVNRVIGWSAILLFACSILYLALLSEMTFQIPGTSVVGVKGFVCTEIATTSFPGRCPWLAERELRQSAWAPEDLWVTWSITMTRLAIVISWLAAFLLLSTILATFIIFQRQKVLPARD